MSFDAYKIAVKLSLVNGVSSGLSVISGHFLNLNKNIANARGHLTEFERSLGRIKQLSLTGSVMGGVGLGMFASLKAPIDEAIKFQTELSKFSSLGFGDKINNQAEKFAKSMNYMGTSVTENMALIGDAMAVYKNASEAQMVTPMMARMKFANEAIFGADGGMRDTKLMDMMKVIEFRGGLRSYKEFALQANYAQQAIDGSRNRVDPSMMLMALKTGGVALSQRSNAAFYLGAEPLIQEFGGSRYGTGAMSIYQNLVQSRGSITAQQELFRLGLLDSKKVEFNHLGMLKKALPGAFKGADILEKDGELALLDEVLLPAFAAKGITKQEDVIRELGMIISNRTGSSLMARVYQQSEKLHMQADANAHAENIDQSEARAKNTPAGKIIMMHKQWASVMENVGEAALPIAIAAATKLLKVFNWINAHKDATKSMIEAFAGLAGLLTLGGTISIAAAGLSGLALGVRQLVNVLGMVGGGTGLLGGGTGTGVIGGVAKIGVLAGSGYVGWEFGKHVVNPFINWSLSKITDHDETLGSWIYDKTHSDPVDKPTFLPKRAPGAAPTKLEIHMDGKKVGEVVSHHLALPLLGGLSGNTFDGNLSLPMPGAYR